MSNNILVNMKSQKIHKVSTETTISTDYTKSGQM